MAGHEAVFLSSLKILLGVQGKYPARWLWNAEECGEHPWAGLEEQWEPLEWECGNHRISQMLGLGVTLQTANPTP